MSLFNRLHRPTKKNNLVPYHRFAFQLARMRVGTRISELRARFSQEGRPRQIIFVHIPKTGGSTARTYIEGCIGSFRTRHSARLWQFDPNVTLSEAELDAARQARFVSGLFSWTTLGQIKSDPNAFTFTILRDPYQRTRSMYFYMRHHLIKQIPKGMLGVYAAAAEQPPEEFLRMKDPRFQHVYNNFAVRALSGDMSVPDDPDRWESLLEQAKQNLSKLDDIGFTDTFEDDVTRILHATKLPSVPPIRRQNETKSLIEDTQAQKEYKAPFSEEVNALIEPLIKYDRSLYDYARELKKRPPQTKPSASASK